MFLRLRVTGVFYFDIHYRDSGVVEFFCEFRMKTPFSFIVVILQNILLIPIREGSIKEQNIYPKLNI